MIKRKVILTLSVFTCINLLAGCGFKKEINTEDTKDLSIVSEESVSTYKELLEKEIEDLGDVTDDIKNEKKREVLYNAIVEREGRDIMKDFSSSITREEAIVEYEKGLRPKIVNVIEMEMKPDHEHEDGDDHGHLLTEDGYEKLKYYVYEGDNILNDKTVESAFPEARNVTVREATYEENIEDVRRALASSEFVKVVESRMEKVLE